MATSTGKAQRATDKLQRRLISWRNKKDWLGLNFRKVRDTVTKLCDSGADLDLIEQRGIPCLPFVFWSTDLVRFFLHKGRNVNAQDQEGNSVLMHAIRHRHDFGMNTGCNTKHVIDFLLAHCPDLDPNLANCNGDTALLTLVKHYDKEIENDLTIIRTLVERFGADVNQVNLDGESVLHFPMQGHVNV